MSGKTARVLLVTLITVLATSLLASPATAAAESGHTATVDMPRYLGGLNLDGYCRAHGASGVKLDGSTAYGWHCVMPDGGLSDIYFDIACQWQYPVKIVTDRIADFNNAYSVQCWQVNATKGRPDFSRYCKATGHDDAVLNGNTVYDWYCMKLRQPDKLTSIDVQDACHWSHNAPAIDRFANFYNPWSWQCWV